jgi:hypothetical protein
MSRGALLFQFARQILVLGTALLAGLEGSRAAETASALDPAQHAAAPPHLPAFMTSPGETDILMAGTAVFLVVAVVLVGILFLRLHTLPERMAHKSQKLQFEIVAVLGLLALFTHMHIFWVAGLILALIEIPDFSTPLRSMAGSLSTMAGIPQEGDEAATNPDPKADPISENSRHSADANLSSSAVVPIRPN